MPTFIEMTPDAFSTGFKGRKADVQTARSNGSAYNHVRRPARGIQIKDDTYATIQVRTADGTFLDLLDGGGEIDISDTISATHNYSNFLMQTAQESRAEKVQIVETFGEPYVFFYGERPRIVDIGGVLLNTDDFNWRAEFWDNYDNLLRGTRCVENKARVYLSWDDIVVEGYILTAAAAEGATEPYRVQFNFKMFLTNYTNVSQIGASDFPMSAVEINVSSNVTKTPEGDIPNNFESSTLAVRDANGNIVVDPSTGSSVLDLFGAGVSILDTIRSGIQNVDTALASIGNFASQFVFGRQLRVPIGYAGGSVFDDVQLALGSVRVNLADPNTGQASIVPVTGNLGPQTFKITASTGLKYERGLTGLKIKDNHDEYIARILGTASNNQVGDGVLDPYDSGDGSTALSESPDITNARKIFADFGIDADPPKGMTELASSLQFGTSLISTASTVLSGKV